MSFSSPDKMPEALRRKIREQHAHDPAVMAAAGYGPQTRATTAQPRQRAKKTRRGPFFFDSETEANVYSQLKARGPVFVQPRIEMAEDSELRADMIQVLEVFEDGTFRGRVIDAKAFYTDTKLVTPKRKPLVQEDAKAKAKALKGATGIRVTYMNDRGEEEIA
jgi:hypothetical protein